QGPLLCWHYPASTLLRPCPTPVRTAACRDVEVTPLAHHGSPSITRTTFPTCRAHYPGGSSGCVRRLLPRLRGLPQMAGGSASALSLSRPAQASLTLRPAGLLSRPKRPLSRGSSSAGHPAKTARQLPDQSTTLRVESSSTDDSRLRGALPLADSRTQQRASSLDHFVGKGEQLVGQGKAEFPSGLEVDDQLELDRSLDGKLARSRALEDAIGVGRCLPIRIELVNSVGQQPADFSEDSARINGRAAGASCQRCDLCTMDVREDIRYHDQAAIRLACLCGNHRFVGGRA